MLSRDEILREMLRTLLKGWGRKAVYKALASLETETETENAADRQLLDAPSTEPRVVQLVEKLEIPQRQKELIVELAEDYDSGVAFPKISDVKAFLNSHHQTTKGIRSRYQGFREMIPILQKMSEKGILTLISRSRHSGPTELGSISDAIRDAGLNLRGPQRAEPDDEN